MEDKTELLVRVSELYYEQGLSQNEVAKILGTSRPSVSRLLDEARENGIVEIIVHNPIRQNPKMSFELRKTLDLREAIVVNGSYDYEKGLYRCCEAAAQFLYTIMDNNKTIGIDYGLAPRFLCDIIKPHKYYNVNVVQMIGCLGTGNPAVDGLEIALRISKKFGGTYSNIYAPTYVKNKTVYSYLILEPQIKATLKKAMNTDIILTGIGSLDAGTTLQKAGYFTNQSRLNLIKKGAVGHLLARPFDINGVEIPFEGSYVIGAPLKAMKAAQWSIGISAAEFKAPAVMAAIRGGYINTLVTDEKLACKLLELAKNLKQSDNA